MKRILFPLILLLLLLSLNSCNKQDINGLTPTTETGEGTLSCIIDEQVWVPNGHWIGLSYQFPTYCTIKPQDYDGNMEKINDRIKLRFMSRKTNEPGKIGGLSISIDNVLENGKYLVDSSTFYNVMQPEYSITKELKDSNYVVITKIQKDYIQKSNSLYKMGYYSEKTIVSGRFNLLLVTKTYDTLRIKDGRFDLKVNIVP